MLTWSKRLTFALRSKVTRISISLSGPFSPLAKEPKIYARTTGLVAKYSAIFFTIDRFIRPLTITHFLRILRRANNLKIMSRCKSAEEMSFYIQLSVSERLTTELGRQISSGFFEMSMLDKQKGADQNSSVCREMSCHTVNLTIICILVADYGSV